MQLTPHGSVLSPRVQSVVDERVCVISTPAARASYEYWLTERSSSAAQIKHVRARRRGARPSPIPFSCRGLCMTAARWRSVALAGIVHLWKAIYPRPAACVAPALRGHRRRPWPQRRGTVRHARSWARLTAPVGLPSPLAGSRATPCPRPFHFYSIRRTGPTLPSCKGLLLHERLPLGCRETEN